MTIQAIQEEIVDEFSMFEPNSSERLEYLIDLGKSLPLINPKFKTEEYLIKGCQSDLWLYAEEKEDKIIFTSDAAAIIPKGIISVLIRVFSNQKPEDILKNNTEEFINKAGLKDFFSMTRSNGLEQMIKQIKMYALVFNAKNN